MKKKPNRLTLILTILFSFTVTSVVWAECIVAISPNAVALVPGTMQTFTANTTCNGETIAGIYTWDVQGGTANTTTGNSIDYTLGSFPGTYTITVTDTAYDDIQGTATVLTTCRCVSIYQDSYPKSHWIPLPALIRIQTVCFEVSQITQVTFECDAPGAFPSIVPLAKLVYPRNGIINQFAIIMPAILTGNHQDETETCTVRVEGCEQTADFELNMLNLGPIPLSE